MVIRWDACGIVNGEDSHTEQVEMRSYHHMEEDEKVGEWSRWSVLIQVPDAPTGGRDNRLTTRLEDNVVRERVYPAASVVGHALFWGSSCVCVTGSKRMAFACDNGVSRWRDGETDRNFIDVDRGQAWVLGVDANGLKSWQHKETQLTAVKDVDAPAPPPEPPPTPK